jgi:signal transduction histidine kinase
MEEFFFNPEKNLWRGSRNLMCVPIKVHEKVLGVLNISDKTTNEPYTEEDLEILCILANHIGIAFSNIFLKEENIMNERLKLAGVMLGTIAHDFRNPLTGIKGYTELLKHGIESVDSRTALEYLNNISMLSERLTTMVNDLLCFISGKNEEVRRDVIQIGKFFNEVLPQIKYLLKNTQIELRTCIDEGGEIEVDKNGFIRALINIVTNSKEAMSVGGILDIDVNVAQNHVEMKFRDNGCGMPSNIQDSIFKPFITYGKKKGIGLGLAIVNQFVKDHDGRLHIESKPGQGTCVTIILPLKPHSKRRDSEEFHQGSSKPQLKIIKENAEFGIR